MERKLILCRCREQFLAALWENGKIMDLVPADSEEEIRAGNIYTGKVEKVIPGMHMAFLRIAEGVQCYYNTSENTRPFFTRKSGRPDMVPGDELIIQIKKEGNARKQPIATGCLEFAGEYAVLTSGNTRTGVSKKLNRSGRQRLLDWLEGYRNRQDGEPEWGVVLRTSAAHATEAELEAELDRLLAGYRRVVKAGQTRTCFSCLYRGPAPWVSLISGYREGLTEIVCEEALRNEVEEALLDRFPQELSLLREYRDEGLPLAKCYSLETVLDEALGEKVWLKSGGWLLIQPTEAMTVIDVNSGKSTRKSRSVLEINLEAAKEIARQVRLRNLSGIIMTDFINLDDRDEQKQLLDSFQRELSLARPAGQVIDMTPLQLVEVTRQKIRGTLKESIRQKGGLQKHE